MRVEHSVYQCQRGLRLLVECQIIIEPNGNKTGKIFSRQTPADVQSTLEG